MTFVDWWLNRMTDATPNKNVIRQTDLEIKCLKDLLREVIDILDTIVPDTFAVGKMILALSKWKQKAEKATGDE